MYENLLAEIARSNLKRTEVAKKLDITTSALRRKMQGLNKFTLDEAISLCELLKPKNSECSIEYLFGV